RGGVPAGCVGICEKGDEAHTLFLIKLASHITKGVSTELGDQMHVSVESGRRNSLVRALPTGPHLKRFSENGLTPFRHSFGPASKIGDERAQHANFWFRHTLSYSC